MAAAASANPTTIVRKNFSTGRRDGRKFARIVARRPGIAVAFRSTVRPFFIAWLTLALLLFAIGSLSHAADEEAFAGFVTTAQDAAGRSFTVGGDTMLVVRQGSGLRRWLKPHSGQRVKITIERAGPEN
jgi:hypothetical protein